MRAALLLALLLAACGSPAKPKRTDAAALPPEKREVLAAFRAGGEEWVAMRERVRDEPALARFVVLNMVDQMLLSYGAGRMASDVQRDGPFERAQEELVALGEHAAPVLAELLDAGVSDAVGAFLAGDVLARIGAPALDALLPKLASRDAETRRRAAALLANEAFGPGADEDPLLPRLARLAHEDPEWIVRAEAAATIARRGARLVRRAPAREALVTVLLDADEDVRQGGERALGVLGDPRAFPALLEALAREVSEGNPRAVDATREALIRLARDPRLAARARGLSVADWRAYWNAERPRLLSPAPAR